ncbi:MAG: polyprenyl synthetase family protein, partial [Clostridiales bacterium]|nr:polyprenyl synthetase family protein [Clostridiales bacterium]
GEIYKAMRYSLLAGGKRLRPVLALAVCEMLGGEESDVLPYGCAIEMIHTYSLIHDDLPAMDNDDFRRGSPTSHKVFGDAIAILAGDALLNKAFELMLSYTASRNDGLPYRICAMGIIAQASGTYGMIGGQVVDIQSEGREISSDLLEYMHECKTGALIKAPVLAAAVLCGADEEQYRRLEEYSANIGLAFQIKDDIMDIEGSFEEMGKPVGSDTASSKSTFVSIYGMDKSKEMLADSIDKAIKALDIFGAKAEFLKMLAEYIASRNN